MLCCSEEDTAQQDEQIKLLLDRMVDGLIIAPAGEDETMRRLLTSTRKPVVLIDRVCDGLAVDSVVLDNTKAVFDATTYLIGLGHRHIGYLSGPEGTSTGRERRAGYVKALQAAGIISNSALIRDGNFREADGYRATMQLLRMADRPSAIFSANNLMVIGAMRAIRDMGLACPEDISVASMDDFAWADFFSPRLTTVAQPVEAIGNQAAHLLLDRLEGRAPDDARNLVLHGNLIVRNSCSPRLH
jgi:LacI family transcriptional regulator